jgi:ketosteroid isomerase-like protein
VTEAAVREAVEAAEAAIAAAIPAHDVEALDRLLHDDLVWTDWAGGTGGKEEDLAAHRAKAFTIDSYETTEMSIELATGDTAVTRTRVEATGEPVSGEVFYTRVWVLADGRWQVRVAHLGFVAAEKP